MNYPSPRTPGSTPIHEWEYTRMSSATPTPSPRPSWVETTPRRPATRAAHSRASSYSQGGASTPRAPVDSPRYNSSGQYATVDVSPKYFSSSSRGPSGSFCDGSSWTVYRAGANSPLADMAGELWLLLIQLSGKVKRAEDVVGRVRSTENREIMSDFIEAGERLTDKLRSLLKACEAPMLKAAKKKQSGLGKNSGVEFVDTLFGRDRELAKTEKFMQSVRLFSLRFDANCEGILQNPSA
ncbi:hypothetical protein M440DRAFT_1330203 [Trichoderma longibrachiatum ATCC 18648]|uniref:Vegetative cell wall protein gp1 n=1 Tax=Trichoderma longibrachiatum ATCC 18648 TaxID=983965 RepID=A0A2T4C7F7_TRILO|nr:hypothetical protein M440DRAFT_1330203 [Trichoderma longibrachiatum ATCC 18648]